MAKRNIPKIHRTDHPLEFVRNFDRREARYSSAEERARTETILATYELGEPRPDRGQSVHAMKQRGVIGLYRRK